MSHIGSQVTRRNDFQGRRRYLGSDIYDRQKNAVPILDMIVVRNLV